jgi:hypothetical protein
LSGDFLDLSWLWNWITSVIDQIRQFFSNLWSDIQQISNTGQGLFAGLASLGSAIWDAIKSFGDKVRSAFEFIENLGSRIKEGLEKFGEWIYSALGSIPRAIYSGLMWVWNGIVNFGRQAARAIRGALSWIKGLFVEIYTKFKTFISDLRTSVNSWWTSLIVSVRKKLKQSIVATLSITLAWKAAERFMRNPSAKSFAAAIGMPIAGAFIGEILGSVVEALVPIPSTVPLELIPSIAMPDITVPEPSIEEVETPVPLTTVPEVPRPPAIGFGLPYDVDISISAYPSGTTGTSDVKAQISTSIEYTIA